MHQQLWGYKVEEKLYLGVREQKSLNTTDLENLAATPSELQLHPCQYELYCNDCPVTISGDSTVRNSASSNLLYEISQAEYFLY
jgi:hypothetical protein